MLQNVNTKFRKKKTTHLAFRVCSVSVCLCSALPLQQIKSFVSPKEIPFTSQPVESPVFFFFFLLWGGGGFNTLKTAYKAIQTFF